MQFSKNKINQYIFFIIISILIIFNGGNSNLLIQFNFLFFSTFFLLCLKKKNYQLHLKLFYQDNKIYLFFYILFLFYLFLQVIPIPINFLKFFSYEKYLYLNKLEKSILYSPISLDPTKSYYQILNYISLLLIVLILKMIFYTDRHKNRFFLFLSFVGFVTSSIAKILYLNNNPNILIFENSFYKDASTAFENVLFLQSFSFLLNSQLRSSKN